jgi:hypothetical protein
MTTTYLQTRPVNAHPQLPVHLERVTSGHVTEYEHGKPVRKFKEHRHWLGSFATPELAKGCELFDRANRQPA